MENKNQVSSSSFTNDLFGAKETSEQSPSSGIFSSIFPPPSTVTTSSSSASELMGTLQKQSSENQSWNKGTPDDKADKDVENCISHKERKIFQERAEPCPLSSSLYYGGQEDMYIQSESKTTGSYSSYKKDGREDDQNGIDSHGASRGNWWQGSLYY